MTSKNYITDSTTGRDEELPSCHSPYAPSILDTCVILLFALVFGFSFTLQAWASSEFTLGQALTRSLVFAGLAFVVLRSVSPFLHGSDIRLTCASRSSERKSPAHRTALLVFVVLILIFGYTLACNYPGLYTRDSEDIVNQALGISEYSLWHRYEGLSSHHPLAYTFLVWLALRFEGLFGLEGCLGLFSAFQALVTALSIAYAVWVVEDMGAPRWYLAVLALYFCVNPLLDVYSISMWKDVLFSDAVLVLSVMLFRYACCPGRNGRTEAILIALVSLAVCLLRSNGPLVIILVAPVFIMLSKGSRAFSTFAFALVFAVLMIVNGPVSDLLGVSKAHFSETVSVPLQQIARTVVDKGRISDSQLARLDAIVPVDEIPDLYVPSSPNRIKFSEHFNDAQLEANKLDFIKLWVELFPFNAKSYVRAWVFVTVGFWEPGCKPVLLHADKTFKGVDYEGLINQTFPFSKEGVLYGDGSNPLYFAGNLAWIMLLFSLIAFIRSDRTEVCSHMLPFIPSLALFLTLMLASPLSGDFRYLFTAYVLLPLYPLFAFGRVKYFLDDERTAERYER